MFLKDYEFSGNVRAYYDSSYGYIAAMDGCRLFGKDRPLW